MSEWKPIKTAPTDRLFLATDWDGEDDWDAASIEVLSGPHKKASGRLDFLNHNSGNYTVMRHWTWWMEKPAPPALAEKELGK